MGRSPADGIVGLRAGRVRGRCHDGVWSYLGIPYARAPVGPLRWRPPEPPEPEVVELELELVDVGDVPVLDGLDEHAASTRPSTATPDARPRPRRARRRVTFLFRYASSPGTADNCMDSSLT